LVVCQDFSSSRVGSHDGLARLSVQKWSLGQASFEGLKAVHSTRSYSYAAEPLDNYTNLSFNSRHIHYQPTCVSGPFRGADKFKEDVSHAIIAQCQLDSRCRAQYHCTCQTFLYYQVTSITQNDGILCVYVDGWRKQASMGTAFRAMETGDAQILRWHSADLDFPRWQLGR
jgi:hypothetical protein